MTRRPPRSPLSPYATLFRSVRHRDAGELFGRELQSLEVVLEHARAYSDVLRRTAGSVRVAEDGKAAGAAAEELQGELETVSARWQQLHDDLASLADAGDRDWAYWRSQGPQARIAELHGAPVWV